MFLWIIGESLIYLIPENMATGIAINDFVRAVFNQEVTPVSLGGISITDSSNNPVNNIIFIIESDNKTLAIEHDNFAYNTLYPWW
jgi:hypothetical protein